jgi:hypothetical protein
LLDIICAAGAIIGRSSSWKPEVVRYFREKAVQKRTPLFKQRGSLQVAFMPKRRQPAVVFTLA